MDKLQISNYDILYVGNIEVYNQLRDGEDLYPSYELAFINGEQRGVAYQLMERIKLDEYYFNEMMNNE